MQAKRLLQAAGGEPFPVGDLTLTQTCSIGWAPFPWLEERSRTGTPEEVLGFADEALYEAKRAGRNCAVGYVAVGGGGRPSEGETFEQSPGNVIRVIRTAGPRTG